MSKKPTTIKEILENAKSRLVGINAIIEQMKEDMDEVVAGIGSSNERHQKRDIAFVVKDIMNVERSYMDAYQMCHRSPTDESGLECIRTISETRDTAIEDMVDVLLPALS